MGQVARLWKNACADEARGCKSHGTYRKDSRRQHFAALNGLLAPDPHQTVRSTRGSRSHDTTDIRYGQQTPLSTIRQRALEARFSGGLFVEKYVLSAVRPFIGRLLIEFAYDIFLVIFYRDVRSKCQRRFARGSFSHPRPLGLRARKHLAFSHAHSRAVPRAFPR